MSDGPQQRERVCVLPFVLERDIYYPLSPSSSLEEERAHEAAPLYTTPYQAKENHRENVSRFCYVCSTVGYLVAVIAVCLFDCRRCTECMSVCVVYEWLWCSI